MKKSIIFIMAFFILNSFLFSKGYYIITLKHGTQIKANSIAKYNGYIKVYKYGGYIIYPNKSIKSIKYVKIQQIDTLEKNVDNKTNVNKCELKIKNFSANPIFNKNSGVFNVEVKGTIINNCEDTFKNLKINIQFMNDKRDLIAQKKIYIDEILPLSEKSFQKVYTDIIADNISYFLYKLQYLREK